MRTRRTILLLAAMVLAVMLSSWVASATLLGGENSASAAPGKRPNILFVLVDDMAASDVGELPKLRNMMSGQGLTFENAFATNTICCPSRATILRGQYVHNHKIFTSKAPTGSETKFRGRGRDKSTIATWLRARPANYRTAYFGKYLNGYSGKRAKYVPPGWSEWHGYVGQYHQGPYKINHNGNIKEYREAQHDTDVLRNRALKFLRETKGDSRPFFMFFSTNAPHAPHPAPPRHRDRFTDTDYPRSPSFNEADVSDKPGWVRRSSLLTGNQIQRIEGRYRGRLRSMLSVQEALASFIHVLEAQGRLRNTYIVFTSDHGFHMGEHRMAPGKRSAYEEDVRIPLMVRGPDVPRGKSIEHLAITNDLAPTFATLAGAKRPAFVDGRSLAPLLADNPPALKNWRQSLLVENFAVDKNGHNSFIPGYRAVHTGDLSYVEYATGEREFYDLRTDPYQLENSVRTAEHKLVDRLAKRLQVLKNCEGDACKTAENGPSSR